MSLLEGCSVNKSIHHIHQTISQQTYSRLSTNNKMSHTGALLSNCRPGRSGGHSNFTSFVHNTGLCRIIVIRRLSYCMTTALNQVGIYLLWIRYNFPFNIVVMLMATRPQEYSYGTKPLIHMELYRSNRIEHSIYLIIYLHHINYKTKICRFFKG